MFLFSIAGLVVGFAVGATGVGGGALMTPLLILGFGLSPAVAVGTDLLYAAITKAVGVLFHNRKGSVDWHIARRMAYGSVPACIATILILKNVNLDDEGRDLITLTLAIAIILTAVLNLLKDRVQRLSLLQRFPILAALRGSGRVPVTILAGALIGALVTLSSVGAGVIGAVTLLLLYPKLPAISVVGTDLAHAVLLTAVAGIGHLTLGTVDFLVLGYLLLGSIPGIYFGTRLGFRLPERTLRPVIATVLLLIGAGLIGEFFTAN